MERLSSTKTETWLVLQQIELGEITAFAPRSHFAAWFEREWEWPSLYIDERGQGVSGRYIKRPRGEPTDEIFVAAVLLFGPFASVVRWVWRLTGRA